MNLFLMNMDREAALITFHDDLFLKDDEYSRNAVISVEPINRDSMPFSMRHVQDELLPFETEEWISHRIIPSHRDGAAGLAKVTGKNFLAASVRKARFASLTDSYWMKAQGEDIKWENVNFFRNKFSYDLGNINFGIDVKKPLLNTPDLSTNGQMKKTWRRRDGKIWLIKQGMYPEYEEPFNEKAASLILGRFCTIPFVEYELVNINGHICSICQNFLEEGQELVTAADLCRTKERPDFISVDDHLKERCRTFNIPGYKEYLDNIRIIDFIIGNYDRHLGNKAFIFDNKEMRFIGPAPIYDNGTSFWNAYVPMPPEEKTDRSETVFRKEIEHMLKKPEKINLDGVLDGLEEMLVHIYAGSRVSPEKAKAIAGITFNRTIAARNGIERAVERHYKKQKDIER